jgi:hypothetical protein
LEFVRIKGVKFPAWLSVAVWAIGAGSMCPDTISGTVRTLWSVVEGARIL